MAAGYATSFQLRLSELYQPLLFLGSVVEKAPQWEDAKKLFAHAAAKFMADKVGYSVAGWCWGRGVLSRLIRHCTWMLLHGFLSCRTPACLP